MTKQQKRADILYWMQHGEINANDALEMLNDLDEKYQDVDTNETFDEMIERIVNKTVADMDMDAVFDIMDGMGWTYAGKGEDSWSVHSVTKAEVIECAKNNVRSALKRLVESKVKSDWALAMTGTGGFLCKAWVDDGDEDNIQVDLMFIPYHGFGSGHLDKLVALSSKKKALK